jgi:formylglycine-generating enzyme required for sulfatase activity
VLTADDYDDSNPDIALAAELLGPDFALVPAGSFVRGSASSEVGHYSNEAPQHTVTLTGDFYLMTTEVTQGMFSEIMGYNPAEFSGCGVDYSP